MKKLYLLCVIICLLPACKKSEEFNIDNIKAPKDYVLFEKADNKLDVENAGTNKYNKNVEELECLFFEMTRIYYILVRLL